MNWPHRSAILLCLLIALSATSVAAACRGGGGGDDRVVKPPPAEPIASDVRTGLLLVRNDRLLVRDMTSGKEYEIARLPNPESYFNFPVWSPDGTSVAVVITKQFTGAAGQDWGSDVVLYDIAGGSERLLFKHPEPGTTIEGIAWTADGAGLYMGLVATTIKDMRFTGQTVTLERIEVATGARTRLGSGALYPAVSPDGSRIAFVTYSTPDELGGIWTAKPDGTDARLIVPVPGRVTEVRQPRFSPDGKTIAFAGASLDTADQRAPARRERAAWRWPWLPRPAAAHGPPMDIWVVPSGGGEVTRLTNVRGEDLAFSWSPDGQEIAVLSLTGLYRLRLGDGDLVKLAPGAVETYIDWR